MSAVGAARFVGQSVARVEDRRILTGAGRYTDDIVLPGMLEAAFVRSPWPHAEVVSIDASAARAMPGVASVFTAADFVSLVRPLQVPTEIDAYGRPVFGALASDRVRFVGDPVAVVLAEDRYVAEDARDAVRVDYRPLHAVATMEQAADPARPVIFDELGSNRIYAEIADFGDPEGAFAVADRIVSETIAVQRVTHVPMEGRGGVADFRPTTGELTYHASTQAPHGLRSLLARFLGHPAERLRVLMRDVGGSFGQKANLCREDLVCCAASKLEGRPVKWMDDRRENLSCAAHAREETITARAAVLSDGTILGLDVTMRVDHGAYPFVWLPAPMLCWIVRTMIGSSYRIDNMRWAYEAFVTNKASYGPYRGPWAAETLVRETLVDAIARDLRLDPLDVRRRNLVEVTEQPRKLMTGATLEGVASRDALERAVELVDYVSFREAQCQARQSGRLIGIGFSTYIEPAPGPPDYRAAIGFGGPGGGERAVARIEADGHLTVITTEAPHGQGHETTLAQIAATEMGIPIEHVKVLYGDTDAVPFSPRGTGGSTAATMASGSVLHATRVVKSKLLNYAADMLEITPEDLEIIGAEVRPKGAPARAIPLERVARAVYAAPPDGEEPDLRSVALFREPRGGWSGGTHACIVEIDPETGVISIQRYQVVEDCGSLINPAIVDGQIRGGVAQGIGIALYENALYDDRGWLRADTLHDYLLPTAMEIPPIDIVHLASRPMDEVNFRGVGEGGTIAAPAAVVNAVSDALGGVSVGQLPLTPERVLALVDRHRSGSVVSDGPRAGAPGNA